MERELPQALICANDHAAGKLMHALLALGFRIPDQVRIAGIDNAPYSSLLPVPLTTVHHPSREIGMTAMGVMLDRLARPAMPTRDVFLATKLVVRDSCGASKVQAPTAEEPMVILLRYDISVVIGIPRRHLASRRKIEWMPSYLPSTARSGRQ
jgi:hypothetical protein